MYPIPFGHGCALVDSRGQVVYSQGNLDQAFSLMSVTKPLTAYTILLVVQQGKLSLDTPFTALVEVESEKASAQAYGLSASATRKPVFPDANDAWTGASLQQITLRHLLSHAAGLGYGSGVQCLPETRRIYSNQGIELAAKMAVKAIAVATGESTNDEPTSSHSAFGPMTKTVAKDAVEVNTAVTTKTTAKAIKEPVDVQVQTSDIFALFSNLAQHLLFQPLRMRNTVISQSPAYAGVSTVCDLLKFAAELSAPTMLRPDLYQRMIRPVFSALRGTLPGYGMQNPCEFGLGVEVRGRKSPHWLPDSMPPETFGHFGVSGSFIWVVPRDSDSPLAGWRAVFLGEQNFGAWHIENWPELQTHMLTAAGVLL